MTVTDHYVLPTSLYIFFTHGGPPGQPQVACRDFTPVSLIFITKLQIGSQESILLFLYFSHSARSKNGFSNLLLNIILTHCTLDQFMPTEIKLPTVRVWQTEQGWLIIYFFLHLTTTL